MHSTVELASPARQSLFARSSYCWVKGYPPGRNQFVSFEVTFQLKRSGAAELHLFADSRYRLWVNDRFVAYGPGRFVTSEPEYDSHDLAKYLSRGENRIRVEVNFYGTSSYQTMPDGHPGFIADGGVAGTKVSFATPGKWQARIHHAWDSQAPLFSFAQNPAEICDTRILAAELASPANDSLEPLAADATPWQKLAPRSVPAPDYALVRPPRILLAGPLDESLRWGMQFISKEPYEVAGSRPGVYTRFSTWIHSPRKQQVTLDCFWSELALNGEALAIDYSERFGNHGKCLVTLQEGWNFLGGCFENLIEHWAYMVGLPQESGASLHAMPDLGCTSAFACSPQLRERPGVPPCPPAPDAYAVPQGWMLRSGSLGKITPARLIAWDRPQASEAQHDLPFSQLGGASPITARAAVWSFDFGDEYFGQAVIEVEAPAGSVLDVAYDDWKRSDGCVNLYGSNPFADAADRFILRGGRQRIEVLNPRGGIYLQVILRTPAGSPPAVLHLHDLFIRRRTTLNEIDGSFTCGDPLLDWAWQVSTHTLQASTDEGYADCPWRERASYIGDSLVNFHLHRLMTSDLSVARRTFANFGKAQLPSGQLACCAPSWLTKPHEDFTLIWIQAVRDLWAYTGDTDFIAEQWPVIRRIWDSPTWKADADGLWDTTGMRLFVDWGVLTSEREGAGNLIINVLRVAAARACREMAAALDLADAEDFFASEAERVTISLCARLWNEAEGRFNPSIGAQTTALHGNTLALRYGIGPAERILAYLEPKLRDNFRNGMAGGEQAGHLELYYFYYLLPALVENDRVALAEELIREHYGFIRDLGCRTLPEHFFTAAKGGGSCCHSWSGAPAIHATESILGLRLEHPGNPDVWKLDPKSPGHPSAEGTLPHHDGPIHVRWQRRDGRIIAQATAPEAVTILPSSHVDLTIERR